MTMLHDDFFELTRERHACRTFDGAPLSADLIYAIIKDASMAPSAKNTQPWRVWVSNTTETNQRICTCLQDDGKHTFLNQASAFMVIYEQIPDNIACSKYGDEHFVAYDVGQFVAYMTLSAKAHGVDSCIIGWVNNDALYEVTGVCANCPLVIALGHSTKEDIPQKKRLSVEDILINDL